MLSDEVGRVSLPETIINFHHVESEPNLTEMTLIKVKGELPIFPVLYRETRDKLIPLPHVLLILDLGFKLNETEVT